MNDLSSIPWWAQILIAVMLALGAFFQLVGALGLARFGDVYQRLHAPTKASTLGVGGMLIASMGLSWLQGTPGVRELLITLFVFITAPVAASMMAQAALHRREPGQPAPPADQPQD